MKNKETTGQEIDTYILIMSMLSHGFFGFYLVVARIEWPVAGVQEAFTGCSYWIGFIMILISAGLFIGYLNLRFSK